MDQTVAEFSDSFKQELNDQLFLKGGETGIKGFERHQFFLLIGLEPIQMTESDGKMHACIRFGVPPSYTFYAWINWTSKGASSGPLAELHKTEVSKESIDFNWDLERFPIQEVTQLIKPSKRSKSPKNGLKFDVDYYYTAIPDIEVVIHAEGRNLERIAEAVYESTVAFNNELFNSNPEKNFQMIGEPRLEDGKITLIMDIGLKNTMRTINHLFKRYSEDIGDQISKIELR